MKKLLALVLALIMVLGLGVTAFADVKVIELKKEKDEDEDLEEIVFLEKEIVGEYDDKTNKSVYLVGPDGGDYYLPINKTDLKNIEVSATGNVTAEIVKFDAEEMKYPKEAEEVKFFVVDSNDEIIPTGKTFDEIHYGLDGKVLAAGNKYTFNKKANGVDVVVSEDFEKILGTTKLGTATENKTAYTYKWADAIASALNDELKTSRFEAVAFEMVAADKYQKLNKNLLKVTVAENYSAAYKEGTVKITATKDKKDVVANLTIISDVVIFEYEEVKWAADNKALTIGTKGYSDYKTAKKGYGSEYNEDALREYDDATVVSTTAFRAIEGEELELTGLNGAITVTIDEVAKGQKGVNFALENGIKYYDEDDEEVENKAGAVTKEFADLKGKVEYFEFGFLGDQVIASDFEIEVKLGCDYYKLRELFGKKVEEEDVITYYVLKDGVKIDDFTVDYKDDDIDEKVELEILGKAGDKLGYYTITLDAPAAEEGEENPNTGAESVVGVVAAMAVVSLVAAAAVSLKK